MADGSDKPTDVLEFGSDTGQFNPRGDLNVERLYEMIVTVTNAGNFKILNQNGTDVSDEYLTHLNIPITVNFFNSTLVAEQECI